MAEHMEEGSAVQQRLDALHFWLYNFPQLEEYRHCVESNDSNELSNHAEFDDVEIVSKFIEIAKEICDCETSFPRPTSASEAWAAIHCLSQDNGLAIDDFDAPAFETRECQYKILCALLCHALSDRCENQRDYVGKVMAIGRSDVQQEIMRILKKVHKSGMMMMITTKQETIRHSWRLAQQAYLPLLNTRVTLTLRGRGLRHLVTAILTLIHHREQSAFKLTAMTILLRKCIMLDSISRLMKTCYEPSSPNCSKSSRNHDRKRWISL
jgi:hypothetical protein